MTDSNWCTIESDPGVFSELIERLGVQDTSVEEIWSLEAVEEQMKENAFGLVYLFKHRQEAEPRPVVDTPEGMVFARQIVHNACATQAILGILLNNENVDLGEMLTDFKSFGAGLDPESMGMTIGSHDQIREIHNMFAKPEPFVQDPDNKKDNKGASEDVFHFVAYIPFQGSVYELDGLKPGPVYLGESVADAGKWWDVAAPAIQERMARHEDINSCLLCVGRSSLVIAQERLELIGAQLLSVEEGSAEAGGLAAEQMQLEAEVQEQERQKAAQLAENVRRRHNFFPLIMTLLGGLAAKGSLQPMVDAAKDKRATALAAAAEANAAKK